MSNRDNTWILLIKDPHKSMQRSAPKKFLPTYEVTVT